MLGLSVSGQGVPPFDHSQLFRPWETKGHSVNMTSILRRLSYCRVRDRCAGQGEARGRMGSTWCIESFVGIHAPFIDLCFTNISRSLPYTHHMRDRFCPLFPSNSQRPAPSSHEQTRYTHEHVCDRDSTGLRTMGPLSTGQRAEAVCRGRRRGGKKEEAACKLGSVRCLGTGRVCSCCCFLSICG